MAEFQTSIPDIRDYRKIILVGSSGSGKSYYARKLADLTGYPLIHLDNEFWQPNWVKTPKDEWVGKQQAMIAGDTWIIDGNYNSTLELRFSAAELIVFLDISRWVCLFAAWKRHGQKRSDLPGYLDEKFDWEFLTFLKWIWEFPRKHKSRILTLHEKYAEKPFLIIPSRRYMDQLLDAWRQPIK